MRKNSLLMPFTMLFLCMLFPSKSISQIRLGVRGGYDVVSHHINTNMLNYSNRTGFQIGLMLEAISPITGLGLELSMLYGRQDYTVEQISKDPTRSNYDYISIPLSIKKRINIIPLVGVFAVAGVYAESRLNNQTIETRLGNIDTKKFAAGLNAGFGVNLLRRFELGMYYRYQLTDNFATNTPDFSDLTKNNFRTWRLSMTYFL